MSKNNIKKRKVRAQRVKKQKEYSKKHLNYINKYPQFIVESLYADIELIKGVKSIAASIDFRTAPLFVKMMVQDIKRMSSKDFVEKYAEDLGFDKYKENNDFDERNSLSYIENNIKYNYVYCYIENYLMDIFNKELRKNGLWDKYMFFHYVHLYYYRGIFKIIVDGFHIHYSHYGPAYYPKDPLTVKIREKTYSLAISKHAMERIFERIGNSSWGIYILMSSAKVSHLKLGNDDGISISFGFSKEHQSSFNSYPHRLATELMGRIPNKFDFLCGYSPVGYCSDNFIHLKTFLQPGMASTPENALLKSKCLDKKTGLLYRDLVNKVYCDEHIEMLKFFHNNGCLQIREKLI